MCYSEPGECIAVAIAEFGTLGHSAYNPPPKPSLLGY